MDKSSSSCASPTLGASFHLTHHCNLRCTYCYTGEKKHIPMSLKIADAGVDFLFHEARKNGITRLDVTFFGGEPLLEKELLFHIADRFISEKENMDVSFKMSTNGTLLTQKMMQDLMGRKIFTSLSLDGKPDTHNRHRPDAGGKGSYHKVENAIEIMLKYNPCTNVTCVITPDSAHEICESVDWIFNRGFRFITLTLDYSADWNIKSMKAMELSYKKLAKWYEEKINQNERFYLSAFDERIRTHTLPPLENHERCLIGQRQFSIAPDGELYPCIQFVTTEKLPEFMIGHVLHGFNENCRSYFTEASEKEKPECGGCALKKRCSSWCACVNYMSTGSIEKASPVICHYERMLLPIVDKMANRLWRKRNRLFVHKHYNPAYPIISHLEITV